MHHNASGPHWNPGWPDPPVQSKTQALGSAILQACAPYERMDIRPCVLWMASRGIEVLLCIRSFHLLSTVSIAQEMNIENQYFRSWKRELSQCCNHSIIKGLAKKVTSHGMPKVLCVKIIFVQGCRATPFWKAHQEALKASPWFSVPQPPS